MPENTNSSESYDIYNENGTPAGYRASRAEAHARGLWHKTVHIWIFSRAKKILLQKRSETKEVYPGFWDISYAGHINAGETPEEGAVRELKEELGIKSEQKNLIHLFQIRQKYRSENPLVIDNEITEVFTLKQPFDDGEFTVDGNEVTGYRFADISDIAGNRLEKLADHKEEYEKIAEYLRTGKIFRLT